MEKKIILEIILIIILIGDIVFSYITVSKIIRDIEKLFKDTRDLKKISVHQELEIKNIEKKINNESD